MGSGSSVGAEPFDRIVEVVNPSKVILGPCRQHHSVTISLGRCRADPLNGQCLVFNPTGGGVPVFDGATGCAGFGQQFDGCDDTAWAFREALLGVHADREVGTGNERFHMVNELFATDRHVHATQRCGKPTAGRGEGGEPERCQEPTRTDVMWIRDDEGPRLVQASETGAAFVEFHAGILAYPDRNYWRNCDQAVRRSRSRSRSTSRSRRLAHSSRPSKPASCMRRPVRVPPAERSVAVGRT